MAVLATAILMLAGSVVTGQTVAVLSTDPAEVRLAGPSARRLLLVTGKTSEGAPVDLTRSARFRSLDPAIATVDALGVVRAVGDGAHDGGGRAPGASRGRSRCRWRDRRRSGRSISRTTSCRCSSKLGCNASGCHGKAEGQNGFKLSVFGFDPAADHAALTKESRGRRVFPAAPEQSLVLLKMSGDAAARRGSPRGPRDSEDYRTLRDWIAAGNALRRGERPRVVAIRVEPRERRLAMKESQQLRVTARLLRRSRGRRDRHARFQSNNEALAAVDADGLVTAGEAPGDVAIMAAYMGSVDVFRALIPRPGGCPRPRNSSRRSARMPIARSTRWCSQAEEAEHRAVGSVHRCRCTCAGSIST